MVTSPPLHSGLLNTLWALGGGAGAGAGGQAFNLFVLRGFIAEVPKDLFEAAEMDDAGHFGRLSLIVIFPFRMRLLARDRSVPIIRRLPNCI